MCQLRQNNICLWYGFWFSYHIWHFWISRFFCMIDNVIFNSLVAPRGPADYHNYCDHHHYEHYCHYHYVAVIALGYCYYECWGYYDPLLSLSKEELPGLLRLRMNHPFFHQSVNWDLGPASFRLHVATSWWEFWILSVSLGVKIARLCYTQPSGSSFLEMERTSGCGLVISWLVSRWG